MDGDHANFTPREMTAMQKPTFAHNLRVQRVKASVNQAQLGKAIGFTQNLISKWETGGGSPRIEQLVHIAQALGCTCSDLLAGCVPPAPPASPSEPVSATEPKSQGKGKHDRPQVRMRQPKGHQEGARPAVSKGA